MERPGIRGPRASAASRAASLELGGSGPGPAARQIALCLALIACAACKREPPREPERLLAVDTELAAVGAVASPVAFDLVLAPGGPLLIWAAPGDAAGAGRILLRALDAFGAPRGPERRVAETSASVTVLELAAALAGSELAVVYREADAGNATRTRMRLVPLEGAIELAEPTLLASAAAEPAQGRGRIAVAPTGDGRARVIYPVGPAPCAAEDVGPCTGFGFRELGHGAGEPRQEPWLSVPEPCTEGSVSVAGLAGRFFYAVCSWRTQTPSTLAYAINTETYYARADEVLRGCVPLGMVAIDAATLLLGADCGVVRRVARLTLDMKPPAEFPLSDLALVCHGDAAQIGATGWALPLTAARGELEAILPESVAPVGARALWTGSALLVAQRMSGGLELRRYTCTDGVLRMESSSKAQPALLR